MSLPHRLVLACALLLSAPAWAATFTVNTDFDATGTAASDANPGDGICATSGAGNCTLRAAIEEANALPGHDTIAFNLPAGGSGHIFIYPRMGLPAITGPVTIDGGTQPGSTAGALPVLDAAAVVTLHLSGGDAGPGVSGLTFTTGASGSRVQYLSIAHFQHAGVLIDGAYQSGANTLQGVTIDNALIGTHGTEQDDDLTGVSANSMYGVHVTAGAASATVSNSHIVGRAGGGAAVAATHGAQGTAITGNRIGTNRAGTQQRATVVGVYVEEGAWGTAVTGNTIGAAHTGVFIVHGGGPHGPAGDANLLRGNRIGVGTGGENIAGSEDGIHITNDARPTMPHGNAIGGQAQGQGNTIAHWGRNGVRIARTNDPGGAPSPANAILGNSIHGNGALGIELIDQTSNPPLGANPQDPPPPAINGGQPAPAITSALVQGGGVRLAYQLSGPAGQAYTVEVFSNSACDASGWGEGQSLIARHDLPDASAGQHAVQLQPLLPGTVLTLTATARTPGGAPGGTSEFSRCLAVGQGSGGQPPSATPVPALGHAALALLGALVGGLGLRAKRRKYS